MATIPALLAGLGLTISLITVLELVFLVGSGWPALARRFAATADGPPATLPTVQIVLGRTRFVDLVQIGADHAGLHLRHRGWLQRLYPPLHIPWSCIALRGADGRSRLKHQRPPCSLCLDPEGINIALHVPQTAATRLLAARR